MVVEHHLGCVEVYQDLRSNHIGEVTILGSNMVEFRPQCYPSPSSHGPLSEKRTNQAPYS